MSHENELTISERIYKNLISINESEKDSEYICNGARKISEACCKLMIMMFDKNNFSIKTEGKTLGPLIDSLSKNNIAINQQHLKKIKASLTNIMNIGNLGSHDNDVSLTDADKESIINSLHNLIYQIFNSGEYINIYFQLPNGMYKLIHKQSIENQNWRCDEVLKIVYPGRVRDVTDQSNSHKFYIISDADGRKIGFIFLYRNINIKNTIQSCISSTEINKLDSIQILTPLEISKDTQLPIKNRTDYIVSCVKNDTRVQIDEDKIKCSYLEDYIFDLSLREYKENTKNYGKQPFFVEQKIVSTGVERKEMLSMKFVDDIVNKVFGANHPVFFLVGEGGIGKTTFCKEAIKKINSYRDKNKIGILISSFDIPNENTSIAQVNSIQDLYRMSKIGGENEISSEIFSINVSSGNIIVVIDGLDEIISKLREKFSLVSFMESVDSLNDTYHNCSVIILSRSLVFPKNIEDKVITYNIEGFDDSQVESYLEKRFNDDNRKKQKTRDIVESISNKDSDNTKNSITPLVIRLASDLADDSEKFSHEEIESDFILKHISLDMIIYMVIKREIKKHKLSVSVDEYFMVLKEIVFSSSSCSVMLEEFSMIVDLISTNMSDKNREHFKDSLKLSPLIERNSSLISIKYDSLDFWIKSRYLINRVEKDDSENDIDVINTISLDCYSGGDLVLDISKNRKIYGNYEKNTIKNTVGKKEIKYKSKFISAICYLFCTRQSFEGMEKVTDYLLELFDKEFEIDSLHIYGDFYPLDFRRLKISNGYFNSFSNLSKSKFPAGLVFTKSVFENFKPHKFGKNSISTENFDKSCNICSSLRDSISIANQGHLKSREKARKDIDRILSVGYRDGSFIWKSEGVYLQNCSSLKTGESVLKILEILRKKGIFSKEKDKDGRIYGWIVSEDFRQIVDDYLTQDIVDKSIHETFDDILKI